MASYNEKHYAIKALNKLGEQVLEIEVGDESRFFIVESFEPPVTGSVSSSPFFTFRGFDLTDFLVNNIYSEGNINMFNDRFERLKLESEKNDFKFSDNHKWRHFS